MNLRPRQCILRILVFSFIAFGLLYCIISFTPQNFSSNTYINEFGTIIDDSDSEIFAKNSEVPKIKVLSNDPALAVNKSPITNFTNFYGCKIPKLEQDGPEVIKFFKKHPPLDCQRNRPQKWVYLDESGHLLLSDYAKGKYADKIKCDLNFFSRKTDNRLNWKTVKNVEFGVKITDGDYFLANCSTPTEQWSNLFMTIVPQDQTIKRLKEIPKPNDWSGLNVHFLGFDSLSQMAFRRNMPKTVDYLEKEMESVVLNGYNIVGDGTPQAFIPILTSQTEVELPLTRKRYPKANFVDIYPFIWNNFSNAGYVTLYGEDASAIGTFTYRLKGFKKQPTDHYTRTFFQKSEPFEKDWKCIGPDSQVEVWLRYAKEFQERYPNEISKFLLMHHSILSHDDVNRAQLIDEPLHNHLRGLHTNGALDNTVVIIMADHGHRFSALRETQQGQLEERMPFFSIYLPKKFRESERGKIAYENLKTNADRLSTPFDIYSTLADLIHWPSVESLQTPHDPKSTRSLSLFREIPLTRTCEQAGIEPHWCTCLSWEDAMNKQDARQASEILAKSMVQTINVQTKAERKICAPLKFHKLEDAKRLVPDDKLMKYSGIKDKDGFVPVLRGNATTTKATYKITFTTRPGDAKYEATLLYDHILNEVTVDLSAISHVNRFGDLPHCIIDKNYFLATYCVCYDKIRS